MQDSWQPHFITQSPLFAVLAAVYPAAWQLKTIWPTLAEYNQQIGNKVITNYQKKPLQFMQQPTKKSTEFNKGYEASIYLRGEVLTRPNNWHDFFNMLMWHTFPASKKMLNYWQYRLLKQRWPAQKQRTPLENMLTHLDENGVIVLSCDNYLIELLMAQRWRELFWQHRASVQTKMQFFILGHALYEKALLPYIGMTGSAIIFEVADSIVSQKLPQKVAVADNLLSYYLAQPHWLGNLTKLAPVPILGIPAWWPANAKADFYENKNYFRDKRI